VLVVAVATAFAPSSAAPREAAARTDASSSASSSPAQSNFESLGAYTATDARSVAAAIARVCQRAWVPAPKVARSTGVVARLATASPPMQPVRAFVTRRPSK